MAGEAIARAWGTLLGSDLINNLPAILDAILDKIAGSTESFVADSTVATTVPLAAAATDTAPPAGVGVTVVVPAGGRRYKTFAYTRFVCNTASLTRYILRTGYSAGGAVVIGSKTQYGQTADAGTGGTGANAPANAAIVNTVFLPAGTYTLFPYVQRVANGGATDTAGPWQFVVEEVGTT